MPVNTPRTPVTEMMEDDMNSMHDTGVGADPAAGRTSHPHRLRGLAVTGFIAALAAMVATTLAAALARAVGVDSEVRMVVRRSRCPGSPW